MTKERARKRKLRKRLSEAHSNRSRTPTWGPALLTFGFMFVFMGVWRIFQKGSALGWTDALFVVLFASAFALITLLRPRIFQ